MKTSEVRTAAEALLTTEVADKVLDRVLDAASEVFVEAGFVRGKLQDWPIGDVEGWRTLHRGFTFRDPANGHVVLVHADLTVGYEAVNLGKSGLRLSVMTPSDEPREPGQGRWHRARKLVSRTLAETPALLPPVTLEALCAARLGTWSAMLEGPVAWDFRAKVEPVLAEYTAEVCP